MKRSSQHPHIDCTLALLLAAIGMAAVPACSPSAVDAPVAMTERVDCEKVSIANPAATYCRLLNYEYETLAVPGQESVRVCRFPDHTYCPQWDFYAGKCGQQHSYCARNGYRTATRDDGNDPFSSEYSVCINGNGGFVGSVTELMGLAEAISRCK